MEALKGMGKFIKNQSYIQFEFGQSNIDNKIFFRSFYYFFKKKNFEIYRIAPTRLIKISKWNENLEHFRVTNYIAENKS